MSIRSTTAFAAGAVVALVLGTGTAYAATGGTFKLGVANTASSTTTLSNSAGTALALNSPAGQPSLRVNRQAKVANLNSDLLDGVDSSSFARATTIGSVYDTGYVDDGGTADPSDDAVVAVAVCPAGSQVVGGGGGDWTTDGIIYYSAPDGSDAWVVVSDTTALNATNAADLEAYARCWNQHANVASTLSATKSAHQLSALSQKAIAKAAARN